MIYHGQASGRNWIAVAKDRQLSAWEKPFSIEPVNSDGSLFEAERYPAGCYLMVRSYCGACKHTPYLY